MGIRMSCKQVKYSVQIFGTGNQVKTVALPVFTQIVCQICYQDYKLQGTLNGFRHVT